MEPADNTVTFNDDDIIVTLISNDEGEYKIPLRAIEAARGSTSPKNTLANLVEDAGTTAPIILPQVNGRELKKVVEYLIYHMDNPLEPVAEEDSKRTDNICDWDKKFCAVEQDLLYEIILAANYLELHDLLHLCCKTIANMIKGKTPDEIKKTFNITEEFTEEQKAQIRRENAWLEEKV